MTVCRKGPLAREGLMGVTESELGMPLDEPFLHRSHDAVLVGRAPAGRLTARHAMSGVGQTGRNWRAALAAHWRLPVVAVVAARKHPAWPHLGPVPLHLLLHHLVLVSTIEVDKVY